VKVVQSVDDARRLALSMGAELQLAGTSFNTDRAEVRTPRPAAKADSTTSEPAAPEFTREEVRRMIAEATAPLHHQIALLLAAQRSPRPTAPAKPAHWEFDIVENSEGAIVHVTARAKP